jgi:hypothetical protein
MAAWGDVLAAAVPTGAPIHASPASAAAPVAMRFPFMSLSVLNYGPIQTWPT